MITATLVVLFIGAVAEVLALFALFFWWDDLRWEQRAVEEAQRRCYVCQTGASVTSFRSTNRMCSKHEAHWVLIHDLEHQMRKELG